METYVIFPCKQSSISYFFLCSCFKQDAYNFDAYNNTLIGSKLQHAQKGSGAKLTNATQWHYIAYDFFFFTHWCPF